jgi:hypothetical protein
MKILMRILALFIAALSAGLFATFTLILFRVRTDLPVLVAWLLTALLSVLCLRVSFWLWSERPFWKDRKRAAEAATAATAFLAILATAQLEKMTNGPLQTTIQLTAVSFVVSAYFVFRRIIPTAQKPDNVSG